MQETTLKIGRQYRSQPVLVNSTSQRCPNKIIKTFMIEDFFPFAKGVNDNGGATWAANISANFRKKLKRP